jgi:hypothetical protein
MVAKSALVDVRPFRTGLVVVSFGLMLVLGRDQGGYVGQALGSAVGVALGATGSTILGVLLLLVGGLLLSGASSARSCAARTARSARRQRARRSRPVAETWDEPAPAAYARPRKTVVDAEAAYPDVVEPPRWNRRRS